MWRLIGLAAILLHTELVRPRDVERAVSAELAHVSQSPMSIGSTQVYARRGDHVCGSLASSYPGVAAPSCAGQFNLCTFIGLMQGCCKDQNNCQFYTTCYQYEDTSSSTIACAGSSCLSCASASPFCTEYRLIDEDNQGNWLGYACGSVATTVFAIANSDTITGITVHASTSTAEPPMSGSGTGIRTSTVSAPSSGSSTSPSTQSGPSRAQAGGIAAGVVITAVLLAIIGGLVYQYIQKKRQQRQAAMDAGNLGPPVDNRPLMGHAMTARGGPYYLGHSNERGQF